MSERKPPALIKDILNCINHISLYIDGLSSETFAADYILLMRLYLL